MSATPTGHEALASWSNALFGAAGPDALIEVRHRLERGGMGQRFFAVHDPDLLDYILGLAERTDVYVAVAPRTRPEGRREAIEHVPALWADCDGPEAFARLRRFQPRPSLVVRSGSRDCAHAYWVLWPPATPDQAERANRRLAQALGADMKSTDAARILRPPGTFNHKSDPPAPVELAHLEVEVHTVEDVVGQLPDPRPAASPQPRAAAPDEVGELASQDAALTLIDRYAPECELRASGAGRLHGRCPLPAHEDRNPSFGLFPDGGYVCSCGSGDVVRLFVGLRGEVWQDSLLPRYRRELIAELGAGLIHTPLEAAA